MIELRFGPRRNLEGIRVEPSDWEALVENDQVIEADQGLVVLSAKAKSSLRGGMVNNKGRIMARGIRREGGRIMLTAGESGQVSNFGLLDASSSGGKGGVATLEGKRVLLGEESLVDVSGKEGGGVVLAGGDWQGGHIEQKRVLGSSFSMSEAREVSMVNGATIEASATEVGNGGTIVLWSGVTDPGSLTLAEAPSTPGEARWRRRRRNRDFRAEAGDERGRCFDTAPRGKAGNWLLDPGNINIISSGTVSSLYGNYEPSVDTTILPSAIESALNSNNLTILTGSGGHYIEITDPINFTNNSSRRLTLNASGDIRINNSVTVNGGAHFIAGGSISAGQNVTSVAGNGVLFQAADTLLMGSGGASVRVAAGSEAPLPFGRTRSPSTATWRAHPLGGPPLLPRVC